MATELPEPGFNDRTRIDRAAADEISRILLARARGQMVPEDPLYSAQPPVVAEGQIGVPQVPQAFNTDPSPSHSTVYGRIADVGQVPTTAYPEVINTTTGELVESIPVFVDPLDPLSAQVYSDSAGAPQQAVSEPPPVTSGVASGFVADASGVVTVDAALAAVLVAGTSSLALTGTAGDPAAMAVIDGQTYAVSAVNGTSVTLTGLDLTGHDVTGLTADAHVV